MKEMKVTWDEKICIHSGECIKNLPSVFTKQDGKFTIIQDGAPNEEIIKVVKNCPSGALKITSLTYKNPDINSDV